MRARYNRRERIFGYRRRGIWRFCGRHFGCLCGFMKLRVGIVGLGQAWETRHRPALRALSDRFEVRAVCCEVAHLAEKVAHEFSAQEVDGFRALASREDVDVVLILAPEWYGPLPVFAACDNGKSVYCGAALDIDDPAQAK